MTYSRTHDASRSSFCGMGMAQYWADLPLWEMFLNEHPELCAIIEMGTAKGGMGAFLKIQCIARGMHFWTFDCIRPQGMDSLVAQFLGLDKDFVLGDFMQDSRDKLIELLLQLEIKPLLLYVDGGDKQLEFATFVPYLVTGDYAAVHDYWNEFREEAIDSVEQLVERTFWEECEAPPEPSLTRFWKRI